MILFALLCLLEMDSSSQRRRRLAESCLTGNKLTIDNIDIMFLCAIQISNFKNLPWNHFEAADKDFGSLCKPGA